MWTIVIRICIKHKTKLLGPAIPNQKVQQNHQGFFLRINVPGPVSGLLLCQAGWRICIVVWTYHWEGPSSLFMFLEHWVPWEVFPSWHGPNFPISSHPAGRWPSFYKAQALAVRGQIVFWKASRGSWEIRFPLAKYSHGCRCSKTVNFSLGYNLEQIQPAS